MKNLWYWQYCLSWWHSDSWEDIPNTHIILYFGNLLYCSHCSFLNAILSILLLAHALCFFYKTCPFLTFSSGVGGNRHNLSMGTLAPDTEHVDPDIYLTLGLKGSGKGVVRSPKILSIISTLLERSVQKNEMLLETMHIKDITIFHGLRAPTITIQQYIDRIFKYAACSPSCFVVAQIYVDRYLHKADVHLTSLNVHRLLITSVMVAAKFVDDAYFNNAYYARVGGVTTAELNRMEMKFLFSLDFRLQVNVQTFQNSCFKLEKEAAEVHQIERPIQACKVKENWSNKGDSACVPTIAQ